MEHYKLIQYYWWSDRERQVASGTDQEMLAKHAIAISQIKTNDPYTCSYRLEKWIDDKHVGGWRFFQEGREFTQDIVNAISKEKEIEN